MVRAIAWLATGLALAGCSAVPDSDRRQAAAPPPRSQPAPRSQEAAQCLSGLASMGASYAPLPDREFGGGCSNLNTVQLASLPSDSATMMQVANIGPVTCSVSQAFVGWARYGADRAARQILGSGLRSIETFGSYSCRNVAGTARRSAHALGAAIDVSGFVLEDGRRITVKDGWNGGSDREKQFLRTVEASACKRFDTVLGPDYNEAHRDHLHVEGVIGSRSYCR